MTAPVSATGQPPPGPPPRVHVQRRRRSPTWVKLWTLVVVSNLGGLLVALWVSRLVRAVPESEAMESGLRFAYFAAMMIIAFIDALLIDELVFGGAFRLSHLQGKGGEHAKATSDVGELAASMQRSSVSFPVVLLVCGLATYLLFNLVNGDFDVYYRRVGKHVSALRGDDPESNPRRLEAISQLSIRREPAIVPVLKQQLARGGEVGAWAAWALGRHTDLPSRRPLYAPLVAAVRGDDPALRREALIALARLQHRAMAKELHAEIQSELDAGYTVDERLLFGLGSIQVMESLPLLERVLARGDEEAQRMAAWALAQHRDQRGGRAAVSILEARLPTASPLLRCAIIHALGILADEASNPALISAYDGATHDARYEICPSKRMFMRPDGKDDPIDLFMPSETLVMKILQGMGQMRATSPKIREIVEPWLEAVLADPNTSQATTESAGNLLSGIREGRDDRAHKSVDEALDEAFDRR